jgi:hypothetical protein
MFRSLFTIIVAFVLSVACFRDAGASEPPVAVAQTPAPTALPAAPAEPSSTPAGAVYYTDCSSGSCGYARGPVRRVIQRGPVRRFVARGPIRRFIFRGRR